MKKLSKRPPGTRCRISSSGFATRGKTRETRLWTRWAKAVFLKGPEEAQARQTLQNVWETLNRDDDLEAFIQEKGQSIGG